MNRKRYSFVLLFFVLALVMACSGTDEVPEQPAQQTTTARTEAEPATSETADAVEPELDEEAEDEGVDVEEAPAEPVAKVDETKPAPVKPDVKGDLKDASVLFSEAPAEFRARFETTKGDFVVNLTREWSPKGVDHFYHLVKLGYYDDIAFFRAIEGFKSFQQEGIPDLRKKPSTQFSQHSALHQPDGQP
jgi:hypothetical protein